MRVDQIWRAARLMTMVATPGSDGLGRTEPGLVAARGGRIVYAGPDADAPSLEAAEVIDCAGRWITPGLIDCHTHLVFGGERSGEFAARLAGASYTELATIGGIRATVEATRAASDAALRQSALTRLDALCAEGVTTVEVKSGYGLDPQTECRLLHIAGDLRSHRQVRVVPTLLAAHAVPPGTDADAYIEHVIATLLPRVVAENLTDALDAFCETIAFSPTQVAHLFTHAQRLGLKLKLHADQLSDSGGAALAARFNALSADHLEYCSADGVAAMARANTVAVLLPGAFYMLRETRLPPVAALRAGGVRMAVATDCNPGSSPLLSPRLAMNMACVMLGLTIAESLRGMTVNAAHALGLGHEIGTLEPGKRADLAIWSIEKPEELVYWLGGRHLWRREYAA